MTLVLILLLAYLFVAPDKATLTGTRGAAGALRAVLGLSASSSHGPGRSKTGFSSPSKSPGRRPLLAGWHEGVTAARKTREDGRDLWSRGSRVGGRVAGGTRNLFGGVRTTVRNRRDRRNQTDILEPDASPIDVATADPVPGGDDRVHAGLEQHLNAGNDLDDSGAPTWPAAFKRAADLSGPAWPEADETRGPQDGELLFSSKTDDLGAAIGQPVHPIEKTGEPVDSEPVIAAPTAPAAQMTVGEVLEEAPSDSRYYVWKNPETGNFFVFDRMNLDAPMRADDEQQADFLASFYNDRHGLGLAMQNGLAPFAVTEPFKGFGSPDKPTKSWPMVNLSADLDPAAVPRTPTAAPALGNTHPSTTTRKDATPMSIAGTELANLDEVAGEVDAAKSAIEALIEALGEIKGWGNALPDRWSGTSWSTDGLDASISAVAEAASELKAPEGLMEQLTAIGEEIAKARTVGEAAAEARAKGDLSGFLSN